MKNLNFYEKLQFNAIFQDIVDLAFYQGSAG